MQMHLENENISLWKENYNSEITLEVAIGRK